MKNLKPLATFIIVMSCTATYAQITEVSTLGGIISKETGQQWIENYKQRFKASSEHTCSQSLVHEILGSADAAGVYLIKGLDARGNERLIVKATAENGAMLKDSKAILTGANGLCNDINTSALILDDAMAKPMIDQFQKMQKKGEFGGHVYGKKVFEDLLSQSGACGVYIAKGLDENNQEHLVLAALGKDGQPMWTGTIWNHGSGIFSIFYPIVMAVAAK